MEQLQGVLTAIVTPFKAEAGQPVDLDRLEQNIHWQIEQGVDGIVPVGTTGESPTLSHEEHRQVIEASVKAAAGRVRVVAGTGSNSTVEAVELTTHAAQCGADAALVVNPYYNKPSQEGMYRHFMTIADCVELPLVLYNIPGRCGVALTPATVARLAEHENIVAIKEATGSMDVASEISTLCDLTILSGDDSLTIPLMSIGGRGAISVLANIVPDRVAAMVHAKLADDLVTARLSHKRLFRLCRDLLTLDVNPVPVKTAMAMLGMDSGELRLPLCEMSTEAREKLRLALQGAGVERPAVQPAPK